jgi:hypothetical protein
MMHRYVPSIAGLTVGRASINMPVHHEYHMHHLRCFVMKMLKHHISIIMLLLTCIECSTCVLSCWYRGPSCFRARCHKFRPLRARLLIRRKYDPVFFTPFSD